MVRGSPSYQLYVECPCHFSFLGSVFVSSLRWLFLAKLFAKACPRACSCICLAPMDWKAQLLTAGLCEGDARKIAGLYDSAESFLDSVCTDDAAGQALLLAKIDGVEAASASAHPVAGKLRKLRRLLSDKGELRSVVARSQGAGNSVSQSKKVISEKDHAKLEEEHMSVNSGDALGSGYNSAGPCFDSLTLPPLLPLPAFLLSAP